jgi:hypothetical protein
MFSMAGGGVVGEARVDDFVGDLEPPLVPDLLVVAEDDRLVALLFSSHTGCLLVIG